MAKLNPNQRIYDVMGEIKRGTYRIPNIQRGFEWNKPRVLKLLDSIMHGYPIGAIMVWNPTPEIQADISDREFVPDFRSDQDYVTDAPHASDKEAYLVLDGQQRLQSLYLSFFGSYDGERVYLAIDYEPTADDGDYGFAFLTPDQAKAKPNMLPLVTIVELEAETKSKFAKNLAQKLTAGITDPVERQTAESGKWEKMMCNIDRFIERFNIREVLLLQEVSSRQTYDHVLEIFERVNSGGMVLSKSDLLFSTLKLKLREKEAEFKNTLAAINHGSHFAFDTDFLIKTSLVVLGKGAKYDVKKLKDNDYIARLKQHYQTLEKCLRQIIVWLDETARIKCDRFLPSRLAIIPLVDYMFLSGNHEKPDGPNSEAMKQYIHMAFFNRLFGRAGDSVLDRIHKDLVLSLKGDPDKHIAPEGSDFPLPRFQKIIQDATNAPYTLHGRFFSDDPDLMLNIVQGGQIQIDPSDAEKHFKDLKLEVDHIFPRSRLRDANMADVADHIGNYRLVVLPINRRKTNNWPDAKTNFSGREDASVSAPYTQALAKFDREIYLKFQTARAAFIRRRVEEFLGLKTGEPTVLSAAPAPEPVTTPKPSAPQPQAEPSLEALCNLADAAGIGKDFRRFCETGQRLGLYPRVYKASVMFTPPQARNRMIFTAWTQPWQNKLSVALSAEALAEFYPVSRSDAAQAIGQDGECALDSQQVTQVLQAYDTLFASFQGRMREPQPQAPSELATPEAQTDAGPAIYFVNTNARYDPNAWSQMLAGSKAAAYYDRKTSLAKIAPGSVVYLYHTGTGFIAKGITTSTCKRADFAGDPDAEFYVPLNFEWKLEDPNTWDDKAVKPWEVNEKLNSHDAFRGTCRTVSPEMAAAIDEIWASKQVPPAAAK